MAAPLPAVWAAGVFVVAFAVRLAHVVQIRSAPFFTVLMGDSHGYDEWAQRIAAGDWIGTEVFYQAPLYPYFLGTLYAAAGRDLLLVRVAQAILGAGACVLLGAAAARMFGRRAGLAAGLVLALYAPAIFFDALIQKSVLDLFLICLSLWIVARLLDTPARGTLWLALGLSMGALSLTRENALVLVLVIVVWALVQGGPSMRTRGTALAAFALGLVIVLVPVAARNYAVGGGFYITTSQFGPNFYIGNNPRADGTYASLRFGRGAPEYERQDATELAELALGRRLTPGEVSGYWTDRALDFILTRPGAWLALLGRKTVLLWNATEMLDTESQETHAEWSLVLRALGWFGHFGVLVPLAVLGLWITWDDRRRIGVLHGLLAAYAASVLLFYVFARYRLPLVPLLVLFAAAALAHLPLKRPDLRLPAGLRDAGPARRAALAGALAAVVAFCNWPVLSKPLMQAVTYSNLGTALHEQGRYDDAVASYERALALQQDYAPAYNNLGVALRAKGNLEAAVDAYRRGLQVQPEYPDLHYNLANALLDQGRADEAAGHFRVALRAIPGAASARNNLGIALAAEGELAAAAREFEEALRADPASAVAHRNLGDIYASQGRIDEGLAHFRRAAALTPQDGSIRYDLGVALLEGGRPEEAESELRAALALLPPSAETHNNLGIALGSQGRLREAIEQFERALAIDPGLEDARQNLQLAQEAGGR